MSELKYHDQIIRTILQNPQNLEEMIEFPIGRIRTNVHFHNSPTNNMEIDILITHCNRKAVIEVKSNYGLRNHFLTKQYLRYIQKFPSAKIFFIYSTVHNSLNIFDVEYEEIVRIKK